MVYITKRLHSLRIAADDVLEPCGLGPLNCGHPEWGESMGWKGSIGEVLGTSGYSREVPLVSTIQVNE